MKINTSNKMTNRQFSLLDKKSDSLNFQTIAEVKLDSLKIQKGFTLLEVMVALAIFAVAAIALTKIAMQYTQSTSNAILRTKAQFVAMNEIATMEINQEWLEGTQSKQVTAQGKLGKSIKKHNQH